MWRHIPNFRKSFSILSGVGASDNNAGILIYSIVPSYIWVILSQNEVGLVRKVVQGIWLATFSQIVGSECFQSIISDNHNL
jgi:hypothetical protein